MLRPLAVLLAVAALAGGCGREATADVDAFAPELVDPFGAAGPRAEAALKEATEHARWLRPSPSDDVPRLPIAIDAGELVGAQTPLLRLVARAHPPEAFTARLGDEVEAIVEVVPSTGTIDRAVHGGLAVERAIAVIDAKIGLSLHGREAVSVVLDADDPQIAILGLDWIVDHRGREWADDVARLVDHPDERVALRAVEALGVVGEARHARALVRLPKLADRAYAHRIYDALSRLGGEDARGFLEFAARNEDDPIMMDVAADALARMGDEAAKTDAPRREGRGHR